MIFIFEIVRGTEHAIAYTQFNTTFNRHEGDESLLTQLKTQVTVPLFTFYMFVKNNNIVYTVKYAVIFIIDFVYSFHIEHH